MSIEIFVFILLNKIFSNYHEILKIYLALTLQGTQRPLFTKHLIPSLICESYNLIDDWLKSTSPTNHLADYITCGLTQELKIW